jgi:hypothetical protein
MSSTPVLANTTDPIVAELVKLNQQLLDAIATGDWDAYRSLVADDITCFEPEARGHLVQGLAFHEFYFKLPGGKSSPAKHLTTTMVAPKVKLLSDNVALVAYVRLTQMLDEAGKAARDARRARGTTIEDRWELDAASRRGTFLLRPYKPMYVLPAHWTDSPNRQPVSDGVGNSLPVEVPSRAIDAKIQLSFKVKLWETIGGSDVDLWGGYSQSSYWQVYTPALSRPFRETNYEPEVFAIRATDARFLGWAPASSGWASTTSPTAAASRCRAAGTA